MKRDVDIQEISDGRFYSSNDMVKLGCAGCGGCCKGMGSSVVLDPLDVCRLSENLGKTFDEMLSEFLELQVVDGVILPNLRMSGPQESCVFLSEENRCRIHRFRPGVCRLFPLGRYYQGDSFQYFVQKGECHHPARTKVKIHKWLETPDIRSYEAFVQRWHHFLRMAEEIAAQAQDQEMVKNLSLYILSRFYRMPFDPRKNFYEEFEQCMIQAENLLALQ